MIDPARFVGSRVVEAVALGKRKASEVFASGSVCGSSSSRSFDENEDEDEFDGSDFEGYSWDEDNGGSETEDRLRKGLRPPSSDTPGEKPYRCTHHGCTKSYTKPSRLAEHRRSHTGERPYVCSTCDKSYLRDSHLQAHARSHLPASERPFVCTEQPCSRRFWTTQHLNVHITLVHMGEKPFGCKETECDEHFAKHNQLRRHVADVHCPSGTQPYQCIAPGCDKSFATNQKLRKHSKVHEANRYACLDTSCNATTSLGTSFPQYFPTWTALQAHIRERHPPTCPHAECEGRTFTSHKGLKGHLKVHEDRRIEDALEKAVGEEERPKKRRRGGEVGRDWACEVAGCVKTFKSKKALTTHTNITHFGRRDHVCFYPECGRTFGYKHLLQRHTTKMHPSGPSAMSGPAPTGNNTQSPSDIAWITGVSYTSPSAHRNTRHTLVPCPWPDRFEPRDVEEDADGMEEEHQTDVRRCAYVFSRAYDLRRHLKTDHALELTRDEVDGWVKDWRERHPNTK